MPDDFFKEVKMEGEFKIIDKRGTKKVEEEKKEENKKEGVKFEEIVIQIAVIASSFMKGDNKNLQMARHYIDLLDLLEEKTKNNLSKDEENFLKSTITQLKMEYINNAK